MLDMWRLYVDYSPSVINAVFRRNDSIDTDSIHRSDINAWYRRLLAEAPREMLVSTDLSDSVTLPAPHDGCLTIPLPPDIVRVMEVRLASWHSAARIITDPASDEALFQLHPYTRATPSCPVAVFHAGELRLYPAIAANDSLVTLSCVRFSEDEYCFDDSALSTLHASTIHKP